MEKIKITVGLGSCGIASGASKIYEALKSYNLPITVFIPKCYRDTVSQMVYLSNNANVQVYVGKCTPIVLNPSLMLTMRKVFNIRNITTAKKDLEDIKAS